MLGPWLCYKNGTKYECLTAFFDSKGRVQKTRKIFNNQRSSTKLNISWNIEYPVALVKDTSVRIINPFFVKETSDIFSVLFQF